MTKFLKQVSVVLVVGSFLTACVSTPKQESAGQMLDSSANTVKIQTALASEMKEKSLPIKVKSYKGVVQLSGFVDNQRDVRRAGQIAQRVQGVQKVQNDLLVKTETAR